SIDGWGLVLDDRSDFALGDIARLCAGDVGAAAQTADARDLARASAGPFDAPQTLARGDRETTDVLERLLLVAVHAAVREHVGDRACARRLRTEDLERPHAPHLLGEARTALFGQPRLLLGLALLLLLGDLFLLGLLLDDLRLLVFLLGLVLVLLVVLLGLLLLGRRLLALLHDLDEAVR